MKKIHAVVYSPCGGCAKVADAICAGAGARIHNLTLPKNRGKVPLFGADDFVIFVFPVYGGRMPRNIENVLANVRGEGAPCALVAVYGNREWEGALLDLNEQTAKRGFVPIAAAAAIARHSAAPHIASGRPDKDDRDKLADFGRRMLEKLEGGGRLEKIPGAHPEWKMPPGASMFPETDSGLCVSCGECVNVCPCGAIPQESPRLTDTSLCGVCAACVQACPQGARSMGNDAVRKMIREHLSRCMAARKEPELFI